MTISRNRRTGVLVGLMALIVILGVGSTAGAQTLFYVDQGATGADNGTSWTDAYTSLQDALTAAQTPSLTNPVQIWVAAGTYTPGSTQDESFFLHDSVALYGGFPADSHASNPGWSARDPSAHETILSGDIGTQDVSTDNCFHVVQSTGNDGSAVLDGFTITGGYDDSSNGYGGGMLNDSSSPTVRNCTFSGNNVLNYGGGMYNTNGSSPTVTDCIFTGNTAQRSAPSLSGYGGGMANNASSPTITHCVFGENEARLSGGGMYNNAGSAPTITDCTFSENSANGVTDSGGGGIFYDTDVSPPAITGCTFTGNKALDGGGAICIAGTGGALTLTDCTITENTVTYSGGGVCTRSVGLTLLDCVVAGNSAGLGGGIYASTCDLEFTNVVVSGNLAEGDTANNGFGGGIYVTGYSGVTQILTNVTFSGNRATNTDSAFHVTGGALYTNYSEPDIRNCIFWNNEDSSGIGTLTASVANDGSAVAPTFSCSLIQGAGIVDGVGWDNTAGTNGGGNLEFDPQFVAPVNPGDAPTTAGNLRLQSGSPAIDAGGNSFVTATTDLDGSPRIVDGTLDSTAIVDLGAYEFQPGGAGHGDVNGDGVINVLDVRLCLQIAQGVIPGTAAQRQQADMNGDGQVTLGDTQLLAQYVMMH